MLEMNPAQIARVQFHYFEALRCKDCGSPLASVATTAIKGNGLVLRQGCQCLALEVVPLHVNVECIVNVSFCIFFGSSHIKHHHMVGVGNNGGEGFYLHTFKFVGLGIATHKSENGTKDAHSNNLIHVH